MFGRSSSKRRNLSHRKSTSSVRSKHESIDPETARQHAHAAATLAFARAKAGTSIDGGLSRNNSRRGLPRTSREDSSGDTNVQPTIKRQQSVRFAGPNAIPRRQALAARASQTTIIPKASNASLRPRAMTTDTPVPAQYRPPSRSSSIGRASVNKSRNGSFVTALTYDEYYTREDDIASTPSSYRRIRKSKSMFSPVKAPSIFYTNGTPDSRVTRYERSFVEQNPQDSSASGNQVMRTQKSMSFLRGGLDHVMSSTRQRNDTAVQIARDNFLHNVEQQRLRAQPSFLFRARKAREEKPFRQSVRSSSGGNNNSYGHPVLSTNQLTSPKRTGLKGKAKRAFGKLKKAFGASPKGKVGIDIPNQQVEAQETHVRKYKGDEEIRNHNFQEISHLDKTAVSRVVSGQPEIHAVGSDQQLRSAAGSVQSMRSESISDDKSRVTSWAVSSNNNTISSQSRAQNELDKYEQQRLSSQTRAQADADRREQQRLSVINEHGTHHSSATFARRPLANQYSAYPAIPSQKQSNSTTQVPPPLPGPVDSARVYSALMKRLDENSPQAKLAASRKNSLDSLSPKRIPPRSSSVDRQDSRRRSRPQATIRQVQPSDSRIDISAEIKNNGSTGSLLTIDQYNPQYASSDEFYPAAEAQPSNHSRENLQWAAAVSAHGIRGRLHDDVFSPERPIHNTEPSNDGREHANASSNESTLSRKQSTNSYHTAQSTEDQARLAEERFLLSQGWTPQEIARRNEPVIAPRPAEVKKKRLRESRSTFFGGSAMTLPRTTSPYRQALADYNYNPAVVTGESPVRLLSPLRNPLLPTDENAVPGAGMKDPEKQRVYSESIYSRTTSGQTPAASTSTLALVNNQSTFLLTNSGPRPLLSFEDRQRLYSDSVQSKGSRATSNSINTGSGANLYLSAENNTTLPVKSQEVGEVVTVDQPVYRPSNSHEGHRATSSAGSNEWKGWMSGRVAVLEQPTYNGSNSTTSVQTVNYALPSISRSYQIGPRHRRENAQIDDEDIASMQQYVSDMKQPIENLEHSFAERRRYAIKETTNISEQEYTEEEMPQRNISNFINDLRMQSGPSRQRYPPNAGGTSKGPSQGDAVQPQSVPALKPILKKPSTAQLIEPNTISTSTIPTPPPIPPPRSPLRQTQNKESVASRPPNSVQKDTISLGSTHSQTNGRNVLHKRNTSQSTLKSLRSSNGSQATLKSYENASMTRSSTKLVKKNSSVGKRTPLGGRENEKDTLMSFEGMRKDSNDDYGENKRNMERFESGIGKADTQQLGSKRMVDMFLSSRRRRIDGSDDSTNVVDMTGRAFI